MDEKQKSIWKKSFAGRMALVIWLAVVVFTIMLGSFIAALADYNRPMSDWPLAMGIFAGGFLAVCLVSIYVIWPLLRWLFWKHWRRTFFALACVATLIALAYAEEDWRGWQAWEKFKHEWEAKGEKFDFKDFIPPPVPDDQNFAMAPIWVESMKATLGQKNSRQWFGDKYAEDGRTNFVDRLYMPLALDEDWPTNGWGNWQKARLTDLKPWQDYYRKLAATTNLFPVAPQPQSPAQDVLLALGKYDPTIEELRQASLRPYSRFPMYNADEPFDILLPQLAALKRCMQTLELRTIAELENNEGDKALADIKLMLRLTDSTRTDPFLISHLVRIAMIQIAMQSIYQALAQHKLSDAQLADLDSELAKLDFLADYKFSMRGERAGAIASIEHMRRTRKVELPDDSDDNSGPKNLSVPISHLLPDAFFYQNELAIARMQQLWILPMVDVENKIISPSAVHKYQADGAREFSHYSLYKVFAEGVFPALKNAFQVKTAWTQSSVDLARTAIALERYRLAHGEYPESLDALAPQFIAKVPHDVINGEPLKYRRAGDGQFVLYSVGWNETDDGGVVALDGPFGKSGNVDNRKGDWVWRYPQK
jgi:hypothetical protein